MINTTAMPLLGTGTWLSLGSPLIAEIAAECGFQWLLLDMEHGALTEAGLLPCLMAAKKDNVKLIVRVGNCDPLLIARALDWGATGIMVPHVSHAEQAKACVQAMRYPPMGKRGYSSSARSHRYGLSSPQEMAKAPSPLLIVQIEDYEGVTNAEAIGRVEGVDVLFVGPADLKLDLSSRPERPLQFDDALRQVINAASRTGVQAGILAKDKAEVPALTQAGFTNIAIGSDIKYLREGFLGAAGKRESVL